MKLNLTSDRVLIRPQAQPTETESGLHLVYDRQRSTMTGDVVALGTRTGSVSVRTLLRALRKHSEELTQSDGTVVDGISLETATRLIDAMEKDHEFPVGSKVIFSPDVGSELFFERDTVIAMHEDDVLAVVEE